MLRNCTDPGGQRSASKGFDGRKKYRGAGIVPVTDIMMKSIFGASARVRPRPNYGDGGSSG